MFCNIKAITYNNHNKCNYYNCLQVHGMISIVVNLLRNAIHKSSTPTCPVFVMMYVICIHAVCRGYSSLFIRFPFSIRPLVFELKSNRSNVREYTPIGMLDASAAR